MCYNGSMMEGNRKNQPRALLVFGAPCSGKTTFAENFAAKFGLAYYDLTRIREDNGFSHENILSILELITRTGQTILLEGELDTEKGKKSIKLTKPGFSYTPEGMVSKTHPCAFCPQVDICKYSVFPKDREKVYGNE